MIPRKPATSKPSANAASSKSPLVMSRNKRISRRASGATIEQQSRHEYHELIANSMRAGDEGFETLKNMLEALRSTDTPSSLDEERVEAFAYQDASNAAKVAYNNFDRLDHDNRVIRLPKFKRLLIKYAKIATRDANTAQMNGFIEYAASLAQLSEFCGSVALGKFDDAIALVQGASAYAQQQKKNGVMETHTQKSFVRRMSVSNSHMSKLMILKRGLSLEYLKSLATYMCVSVSDVAEGLLSSAAPIASENGEEGSGDAEEKCVATLADEAVVNLPTYYVRVEDPVNCSYCMLVNALCEFLEGEKQNEGYFWFETFCATRAERSDAEFEDIIDNVLRTTHNCIVYLPAGRIETPETLVDALKVNAMASGRVHVLGDETDIKGYKSLEMSGVASLLQHVYNK